MFERIGDHQRWSGLDHEGPLHVCGACDSSLVQLVEHESAWGGQWHVMLRCPECEAVSSGLVSGERGAELDAEMEYGTHELLKALVRLQRQQMVANIACFAAALEADVLLPEDF